MTLDQESAALARIDDQIAWYDRKSSFNQSWFKRIKLIQLLTTTGVPLTALAEVPWVTGSLGAIAVLLEGLQALNQYQHHWIQYRATCEQLKHERHLYAAGAGMYRDAPEPYKLLAENTEALVSTEHAKWMRTSRAGDEKAGEASG